MKLITNIPLCPYPDPNDTIYNPVVPYWGSISGGLRVGKLIEIKGHVPYGCDCFHINLVCGEDNGPRYADRAIHISVRFRDRIVVRNTMTKNSWDNEERGGTFPFEAGKEFMMMILIDNEKFHIAVNGKHEWDFKHRHPFSRASMLYIDGVVKLDEIRYFSTPTCCEPSKTSLPESKPSFVLGPVLNPKIPYFFPIPEGLKPGTMIYISGRPTINAQRFTVNLQCDSSAYQSSEDIAFHFDARMSISSLVRNTRVKNNWGREEVHCPYFPFQHGVFFDMIIRIEADKFMVALNGQHFLEYYHRIFPLTKINMLNIEHDIVITSIRTTV